VIDERPVPAEFNMMTRLEGWIAIALIAAIPATAVAKTVAGAPILIDNRGRHSIYNLYAVDQGRRGWGRDLLADATIPAGRSREVTLSHRPGRCLYRLKLVLAGGREIIRTADVCRGGLWRIDADGDQFMPAPDPPGRP
jgi:hypothetical protein